MRITNRKNESAETLIAKAKKGIVRELKGLTNNKTEIYEKFRDFNPEMSKAIKDYCGVYKKLETVENEGLLEEFTLASKNLISSFRFSSTAKDYEFISDNFVNVKESPLYKAMEAIFDVSLFKEEGKARLFTNVYNLQTTIAKVNPDEFIFFVKPYFYYVNTTCGVILRRTDKKVLDFDFAKYMDSSWSSWYASYDGEPLYTLDDGLIGTWEKATYPKQSGDKSSGVVYDYVRFTYKESREEHGGKVFYMPAHQVIALCWYQINILKFCLGSGSLITIDHRNNNSRDNSIMNLALLTRVDNTRKASTGEVGVNFLMFFEVLGLATSPFDYSW